MLFKSSQHQGLRDGSITLSFRLWKRPQARVGGRYRFAGDEWVRVTRIAEVSWARVKAADARRSGHEGRDALAKALGIDTRDPAALGGRTLYRIDFEYAGRAAPEVPDQGASLSPEEWAAIEARLDGMDRRRGAPFTTKVLCAIRDRPGCAAARLAEDLGWEKAAFKADVRKLKGLGLTVSLEVGYRLSPRGLAVVVRRT